MLHELEVLALAILVGQQVALVLPLGSIEQSGGLMLISQLGGPLVEVAFFVLRVVPFLQLLLYVVFL